MLFKNRLMLLTDDDQKGCIVINNAYYGQNMPIFFEKKRFTDDKIVF